MADITPMKLLSLILIMSAFPALAGPAIPKESDWRLSSETDGVKVFKAHTEGLDTVSMRGETMLNTTRTRIIEIMSDTEGATKWMPLVIKKVLIMDNPLVERIEATFIDIPWPFVDRVFVSHAKMIKNDAKQTHIIIEDSKANIEHEGFVRGQMNFGRFFMTENEPGKTHIIVEVNSDPKGHIPAWMVNWTQANWPVEFFQGIRSQINNQHKIQAAPKK
jgi:hypothetical protein